MRIKGGMTQTTTEKIVLIQTARHKAAQKKLRSEESVLWLMYLEKEMVSWSQNTRERAFPDGDTDSSCENLAVVNLIH